ncbi:restriction endonuclease subunit S [Macrococcus equipercicus]|uniref:Restriction endonuclease subunit S n=1 Tax=Macrococcus equipercicus TaxID=69967 RepID=A0ABQ6R6H9_9STAP|nr:restriction endonuclease subunit S [Macrococcus equipercicus]KAA1036888.1 restriction endonuclease subunit S [Macrococcus equipercicus]
MTNEKRMPELRFPEFSGEWTNGTFKDFGYFYYGKSAPKWSLVNEGGTPCVRYGELYTKYHGVIRKVGSHTNISLKNLKLSNGGEILIPRVGEKARDFSKVSVLTLPDIAIGEMISVYNTKENPYFIMNYIRGKLTNEFAKRVEGGSVSNLYFTELENIVINIPSLNEQQKIGEFFSKLDRQIELEEKKLALLEEQKKGYMQKIFSQELRFKDENGEDYPEWEEKQLNEIVIYENGLAHENYVVKEGKYILVNSKFISTNGEVKKTVSHGELLAMKGDTLLVLSDLPNGKALAKGYFVSESNRYAVNQRIAKMRPIDTHPYFLFLILNRNKHLLKFDNGVSQTNLRKNDILHIKEFIPVLNEQKKISSLMENMDSCIIKISQKITLLKIKKQELLNNMLV